MGNKNNTTEQLKHLTADPGVLSSVSDMTHGGEDVSFLFVLSFPCVFGRREAGKYASEGKEEIEKEIRNAAIEENWDADWVFTTCQV